MAARPSVRNVRAYATEVARPPSWSLPPAYTAPPYFERPSIPSNEASLTPARPQYDVAPLQSRHDWRLTAYSRQRALSTLPPWLKPHRRPATRDTLDGEQGEAVDRYVDRWKQLLAWETESGRARAIQYARLARNALTQTDLYPDPHRHPSAKDQVDIVFKRSRGGELAVFTQKTLYPESEVIIAPGKVQRDEWSEKSVITAKVADIGKRSITLSVSAADAARLGDAKQSYCLRLGWDGTIARRTEKALDHLKRDVALQHRSADSNVDIRLSSSNNELITAGTELVDLLVPVSSVPLPASAYPDHSRLNPVFADNLFIHSWAKRHLRSPPLAMPGDPDLNLNADQLRALATSLHSRLSTIQGPPGTGKTITTVRLLDLIKGHFRIPDTVLVCTPTHVSVEHILQRTLKDTQLKPVILTPEHRTAPVHRRHTLEAKLEQHDKYYDYCDLIAQLDDTEIDAKTARSVRHRARTLRSQMAQDIIARCDVAFSTMAGMSVDDGFSGYADFRVVILDEAAQCSEATSLIPLVKGCAHLTLVGDHKQLPAIVSSERAEQEGYGRSLFERMIETTAAPKITIRTQYRMHRSLARFPNNRFYAGQLIDAGYLHGRPLPAYLDGLDTTHPFLNDARRLVFIDHHGAESKQLPSRVNEGEAEVIARLVVDLLSRYPELPGTEIGVITPYAPQRKLLIRRIDELARTVDQSLARRAADVEVNTVDGFQGREVDIVLLSTVRSQSDNLRFISQSRRVCVALTRARHATILVGNERALSRRGWEGSGLWATLVSECKTSSALFDWSSLRTRLLPSS